MDWQLSTAEAATLEFLEQSPSTNTALVALAASDEPPVDFSVILTTNQTAGRGRLGRVWVAPPGKTIAVSVLLRPVLPAGEPLELAHFGWLPLIAGVAMSTAVASVVPPHRVGLKWPNDVQIDGLKVSGILAELVPSGDAVVIGAGLNLTMDRQELPTPVSTSLTLVGASPDDLVDRALAAYLGELRAVYDAWAAGEDLRAPVSAECGTIGRRVRVELPGGGDLYGTATAIDAEGRLVVRDDATGADRTIAAGDVTHVRHE